MNTVNKLASQVIVKGMIADSSGHSDFLGSVDDAVTTILDGVQTAGKWVYVNGNPFIFNDAKNEAEQALLRNTLTAAENPEFLMTGSLQGGC
jgi:hypothetical protein